MAMTVNASAFLQPHLGGRDLSRLSNIPFWDRFQTGGPEKTFETVFQRDFNPVTAFTKRAAIPKPVLAHVEHKDVRYIKEYQTEMTKAFTSHQLEPISRIPAWSGLTTNLKMHSDERYRNFHTTQSESFPHLIVAATGRRPAHPVVAVQENYKEDKPPNTTQRTSYVPHKISPVVRAEMKHLDGTTTTTMDRRESSFSSSYNDNFQYRWCSPAQSTEKQWCSSFAMGDKEKIAEKETTHSASFIYRHAHRPVSPKEPMRFNYWGDQDRKWNTTTSDTFTDIKPERVHIEPVNRNLSSIHLGDTRERLNQDRGMGTTNSFYFSSEENHKQLPVHVDGATLMTKSNVHFGKPDLGGMLYSTTTQDTFPPQQLAPAQPQHHPPGRVLADQEPGPALSTVQRDYTPPNCRRHDLSPGQRHQIKACHIRFPYSEHFLTTTHKEDFQLKPISKVSLDNRPRQHVSHITL